MTFNIVRHDSPMTNIGTNQNITERQTHNINITHNFNKYI